MEKRRYKLYHLPQSQLRRLIKKPKAVEELPTYWEMPLGVEPLPDGAVVKYIFAEPERGSIGIVIYHESFDVVEEGVPFPEGESLVIEYRAFKIDWEGDQSL